MGKKIRPGKVGCGMSFGLTSRTPPPLNPHHRQNGTRMTDTPDTTGTDEDPVPRPFADVLRDLQAGRTHDELTEKLRELNAAVRETGKPGKIVLSIEVKPVAKSDGLFQVIDNYTVKLPQHDRKTSYFYFTEDANLTKDNPNQPELSGLRVVDTTKPEPVKAERNGTNA